MASNPIESTRRQVALAVIQSYNDWSVDSMMTYRAPNCIHQVLPSSLARPPMTNAAYSAYFTQMLPHFRHVHVTVHDLVEDAGANKVVIWASSTAETDLGPYANEYMLMLYFNGEGKVEKILEFVDTARSLVQLGSLRELMAEKNKHSGN